jgi:Zn-dependent protease with chaperone function
MKPKPGTWLFLSLFGVAVVCLVLATVTAIPGTRLYHLMGGPLQLWMVCCDALKIVLPEAVTMWLSLLARASFIGILLIGGSVLWRRLRQTHYFVTRLNLVLADAQPVRLTALSAELGLSSRIDVLATPVPLAFCYGLLRPRICLSTGLINALSDKELRAVLFHEAHHCRHYDPLRTLLADVLAAMFFFLPVVAEWRDMVLTSVELTADQQAIARIGRPALAGAMYKLLIHPQVSRFLPALSGVTGFSASQARLAQLLDNTPPSYHFSPRSLISSSLALTLGCVLLHGVLL